MQQSRRRPLILIFPFDLLSHYLRCLELAKRLKTAFDIQFADSCKYHSFIKQEGFETFKCLHLDSQQVMDCAEKFDFSWLNRTNLLPVYEAQVKIIQQLKPDLVFGDTSPTLKMAAEKTNVVYYSLMNGYMSKYYAFTRKISRSHPAFKYSKHLPEKIFDWITRRAESLAFKHVHKAFRQIRTEQKLTQKSSYLDELEGDLNLICDLEELFPQANPPDNYRIISPLVYNPSNITSNIHLGSNKKTIFVSMGSTGDWNKVSFLNDLWFTQFNVVTASDNNDILNAPHIRKLPFVNFHNIFPQTDLVICHGGNGTIYQALFYGIPILCKTSHFEQEWNAHGLERQGLGKSLDEINTLEKYKAIIQEWIGKRDNDNLAEFKIRTRERTERLPDLIGFMEGHQIA